MTSDLQTPTRTRTRATGATALIASAAVAGGVVFGQATTELSSSYAPKLTASTPIGGGVAIDPQAILTGIFGPGGWNATTSAWFGDSTAIAVLPGAAIAAAAAGQSATAFSLLGLSIGVTDVPQIGLGSGQASCIGVVAFANSSTDGMCLNILGTLDADYRTDAGEVSVGLTNPLALIGLVTGDVNPAALLGQVIAGVPISRAMTDDFARLTFGGSDLIKLTSDYAFQKLTNGNGAIAIGWLGGEIVFFPVITAADSLVKGNVNYLGLPSFNFSGFPDVSNISNIIPSISVGAFGTPIPGVTIPQWSTNDLVSELGVTNVSALRTADSSDAALTSSGPIGSVQGSNESARGGFSAPSGDEDKVQMQVIDKTAEELPPLEIAPQSTPPGLSVTEQSSPVLTGPVGAQSGSDVPAGAPSGAEALLEN